MRKPERKAEFTRWLLFTTGESTERPTDVSDQTKLDLARYGLVDPLHGFTYDAFGHTLERPMGGRKVRGVEPAELRRQRLAHISHLLHGVDRTRYEQPAAFDSIEEIIAEQDRKAEYLDKLKAEEKPREYPMRHGGKLLISKDPSKPGQWRVTRFEEEGGEWVPTGHADAKTYASAIDTAEGYSALGYERQEKLTKLEQPAFHGSPHKFEKFELQKIGSGEGAQAYGWGLYFASRKEVAEHYRKTLSRPTRQLTVDGQAVTKDSAGTWKHGLAKRIAEDMAHNNYSRDEALEHAHTVAYRDVKEAERIIKEMKRAPPPRRARPRRCKWPKRTSPT
jgi:hypothetical protein